MITTRVIPTGTASATTQELLIEITEKACRPYCLNSQAMPTMSVAFTQGIVQTVNDVAIVPIFATITLITPSANGCGCAKTQVVTESFNLAFTATTANTITLTPAETPLVTPAEVSCCKAKSVKLSTTLTATIA